MFTSQEIKEEHRLATWRKNAGDRKKRNACIPLTFMEKSICKFQDGSVPNHRQVGSIRISNTIIRRIA